MSETPNGNDSLKNTGFPVHDQPQSPTAPDVNSMDRPGVFPSAYPPPFGAVPAPGPMPGTGPQPTYMPYAAPGKPPVYYPPSAPGQTGYPYPPVAYVPYAPPRKKGGCLRAFGLGMGTLCAIAILAVAVGFASGLLRQNIPSVPSASSDNWAGQEDSSSGTEPSADSSDSGHGATPTDPSEHADPNGPSLEIQPPPSNQSNTLSPKEIASKFKASVVSILVYIEADSLTPDNLYGEGTGIVMSANGYILTNSHVIGDSLSRSRTIVVTTNVQKEYTAKVVGFDTRTDLAVLKIDATGLVPAEFGDSSRLEVGDPLVAIGNGGGIKFAGSVTAGIVSAVERAIDSDIDGAVRYIQTDAAINPGNSGGPLINQYGQVIGVNTAKISGDGYEGMGFAIPSMTVRPIVDDLIHTGYVEGRSRLGVTCEAVYSYSGYNVVIHEFSDDSDFHNTDARTGDIIVEMDGHEIFTVSDVYAVIGNHKPGDIIKVKLMRPSLLGGSDFTTDSGTAFTVSVKLLPDLGDTQQVIPEQSSPPDAP